MLKQHTLDMSAYPAIQSQWLIDQEVRESLLAQLLEKGQVVLGYEEDPIHYTDYNWVYYEQASKKGSIAVMSIKGVIYDYYAEYLCMKMSQMYQDKNLVGAMFKINSPGGSGDAGYKIADMLMSAPFPTRGYIDYGQCNSAGFLIATSMDGISASRPNDRVGSIGAYLSYQDSSKYWEKAGIVSKDIYARQSTEKNQEFREAAKGNFKPLEDYVSEQAQAFIDYVQDRRPNLNTKTLDPFKGKVFSATDALSIGLIDHIGDLKSALSQVKTTSSNTNVTPRTNMLGFTKMPALLALKGLTGAAVTEALLKAANEELEASGLSGVAVVSAAQLEQAVAALNATPVDATALSTAQADVTRLTTELATANTNLTTVKTELATAQTEITRLGGMNGAEKTVVTQTTEKQADAGVSDESTKLIDSLEHNMSVPEWLQNPVKTK